ncbi:MAG: ribonuclease III [Actinomycetota bacterium]|nr:ribonuclease III [Actinomycetota bacterium]
MNNAASEPTGDTGRLEAALAYRISDDTLLTTALTHGSYASEHPGAADYQRLEFLGDAVLEVAVTRYVYEEFPEATEGEMTLLRAGVVSEPALASVAREWGIPQLVRLGRGEELTGGRDKESILSDIVESLLAAVYLDAGIEQVEQIVREHWAPMITERAETPGGRDYKTRLQEILVADGRDVEYAVTETGPQHARRFTAIARSSGDDLATGTGTSKKRAEQDAARRALEGFSSGVAE